MITFQAHKGRSLLSKAIMLFSGGQYSHISIRIDNVVYEAHIHTGVRKIAYPLFEIYDAKYVVETIDVPATDEQIERVRAWLEDQVGKKYDMFGIFAFVFILMKPRHGYWYCSELAIVALAKLLGKTDELEKQKVSPQMFWDILKLTV